MFAKRSQNLKSQSALSSSFLLNRWLFKQVSNRTLPMLQYISPSDGGRLGHAELVVIDEAAAIPLPLVRKLLGPHLVFMASTING